MSKKKTRSTIDGYYMHNMETMTEEVKAWENHRNNKKAVINWQFTTQDARIKTKKIVSDNFELT